MLKLAQMENVRVRIAPSPTGYAHVGTAYTALLNYAFARRNNGKFIVRIEDSDLKRNIKDADEKIYKALEWLNIKWDEGPFKLSDRLSLYKQKANELLKKKLAYEDQGAIRFKSSNEDVSWKDLVRGEIRFSGAEIKDFVLLKSDGYPTYNFNVVVDDIDMKISHVIRGEDHVSNTPRQIALYKAFGVEPPFFAHHPMLLNTQRKKLSKRDAAVDIEEYRKMGILPEAFVNFLCLMGWSHPEEKDIFDLEEFVNLFSLERVRKSGAIFDINKLLWINQQYIINSEPSTFNTKVFNFYSAKYPMEIIEKVGPLVQTRVKTLKDFDDLAGFLLQRPTVDVTLLGENYKNHLVSAVSALSVIDNFDCEAVNHSLANVIRNCNYNTGKFFMDLRIAVTGKKITPPLTESMIILGKEETLTRIKSLVK